MNPLYSNLPNISNRSEAIFDSHYGQVWLVGFGPGDPDLLTLKGYKLLKTCDIIYYDDLLNKEFLYQFDAAKFYVGKRRKKHSITQDNINQLMLESALAGKMVVRLKGGDPMLFAHGGEEIEFLKQYGIQVEVVPGITAAVAASAASQIPLTHRGISSSVTFITGHSDEDLHLPQNGTIVIYMGAKYMQKIALKAIYQGWDAQTLVLLMYNISNPDQEEEITNLNDIANLPREYKTPLLIIIGKVVGLKTEVLEEVSKYQGLEYL